MIAGSVSVEFPLTSTGLVSIAEAFAAIVSFTPPRYPMPYPISQADRTQHRKSSQKKIIASVARQSPTPEFRLNSIFGIGGGAPPFSRALDYLPIVVGQLAPLLLGLADERAAPYRAANSAGSGSI